MASKILVVEDTGSIREFERRILERAGYAVLTAVDGVEGLSKARVERPDLILMDINMPRMDGVECCEKLKADDATKEIKIIMVTTEDQRDKVQRAFAVGCDGYVTKPVDEESLLRKIRSLLRLALARKQLKGMLG